MTVRQSFKRLVRARMSRTGESYTTARRHVLAAASAEAVATATYPGLLPGYRAFGGGQHHASAALAHALDAVGVRAPHTGAPYTEAMVAGLAGGIGFMYAVFDVRRRAAHDDDRRPAPPRAVRPGGARPDRRTGAARADVQRADR